MIVDGKKIADEILSGIGDSLRGKTLGMVVNAGDLPAGRQASATESFVKIKERVAERLGVHVLRSEGYQISFKDFVNACDGVLVQLPHSNAEELIAQIPPAKDVDALGPDPLVEAPVAGAVKEVLLREATLRANGGSLTSAAKAAVVGEGRLVGKPVARMLHDMGYEVSVVSLKQGSLSQLKDADIVVSGAGSPGLIRPEMLKEGVVLIDVGTSESRGKVVGDADPACAEVASVFTPVPGGVGPIAVAMLFKNLFTLVKHHQVNPSQSRTI